MPRSDNIHELPDNLSLPVDDGACDHLPGKQLPSVPLQSTTGRMVDISALCGTTVVYCYPRTGRPDQEPPQGWNEIPGARGCTPQSCAFRDHNRELQALGARVFGLSTQDTDYQREAVERLHLPFELLSDERLAFATALGLPTFMVGSMTLIKRRSFLSGLSTGRECRYRHQMVITEWTSCLTEYTEGTRQHVAPLDC
jgi:peroxiredoxin